jgi:Tol biopolymer transport system component
LPYSGGIPKPITTKAPSFWHWWSPKSKELVYVGFRNENFDIFTIFVAGGEEKS